MHVDGALVGYVATRAHHSDVGGMEPGSMPGKSSEIYQEGIVIPPVRLYAGGELQDDVMRLILANVRTATERRGDLNAQLAAIRIGERRLGELAERYGARVLAEGFEAILDYAERRMRKRIAELPPGTYLAEDCLDDDGSSDEPVRLKLRVDVTRDKLTLDFAGSSPQRRGNINAVAPMTHSAVVLRRQDADRRRPSRPTPASCGPSRSRSRRARSSTRSPRRPCAPATPRPRSASPTRC